MIALTSMNNFTELSIADNKSSYTIEYYAALLINSIEHNMHTDLSIIALYIGHCMVYS